MRPDDSQLSAYLDGELSEEQCREVEVWLAKDETVAQRLESLKEVVSMIGALSEDPVPSNFTAGVENRIRRHSHGRYFNLLASIRFPYDAVASVALVFAMVFVFMAGERFSELSPVDSHEEARAAALEHLNSGLAPMGAEAATSGSPVCVGGFDAWVSVDQVESARLVLPVGFEMESITPDLSPEGKQHLCFRPEHYAKR